MVEREREREREIITTDVKILIELPKTEMKIT